MLLGKGLLFLMFVIFMLCDCVIMILSDEVFVFMDYDIKIGD